MSRNKVCIYWCNVDHLKYTCDEIQNCSIITGLKNPDYKNEIDLTRHVTGLLLAEWAANQFEKAPQSKKISNLFKINYGINLKPCFTDFRNIKFNISHSGSIVVCAISDCEVGVDIEFISEPISELMEGICDRQEVDWLHRQGDVESQYRLWTYKECFLKCTGEGIRGIENTISMIENGILRNKFDNYYFNEFYLEDNYAASVCTAKEINAPYIEKVDQKCLLKILENKKGLIELKQ